MAKDDLNNVLKNLRDRMYKGSKEDVEKIRQKHPGMANLLDDLVGGAKSADDAVEEIIAAMPAEQEPDLAALSPQQLKILRDETELEIETLERSVESTRRLGQNVSDRLK